MSYVEKCLVGDERVVYTAHLHWIVYSQGILFALFGGVLGHFMPTILALAFDQRIAQQMMHPAGIACAIIASIGGVLIFGSYIRQVSTELAITNRRIIAKYGYISRTTFEIMLDRVTGANFDQTIWGRILGFGTVLVHGAGGDISPFDNVADPQAFHNALMVVLDRNPGGSRRGGE